MSSELLNLVHLLARQEPTSADPGADVAGADAGADAPAADACAASNYNTRQGLRIGAIFVILVTSLIGTLTPIILRSVRVIPRSVWEFAKFFGSGVIIATAFIHLLAPAWDALGTDCLVQNYPVFGEYNWAPAIAMMAVYFIFFAETAAYRLGTAQLAKLGIHTCKSIRGSPQDSADTLATHGTHGEMDHPQHTHSHSANRDVEAAGPSTMPVSPSDSNEKDTMSDSERTGSEVELSEPEVLKQILGVAVLEFGVVLHSVIIGLTLAVDEQFVILFIVIIFHQMFEGLGLGSRLAVMRLPHGKGWIRYAAALTYCICTPIGMAAGLGAIQSFNGNAATTNLTTGVLDAFSAGILLYTGLVELIAHEILFNPRMMNAGVGKLTYVFLCMCLGSGLMALLGKWA